MQTETLPEVWLRGVISDINPILQPAAQSLLQTVEELHLVLLDFPDELLIEEVAEKATAAFHLRHMTGVVDRMLTYAKGQSLTEQQFSNLANEKSISPIPSRLDLKNAFIAKVDEAITYFKTLKEEDLKAFRGVGRKQLPSTVLGVLYHAAEHAQRHLGQLLVTVSVLKSTK